jgi:putative transcriptional regulator
MIDIDEDFLAMSSNSKEKSVGLTNSIYSYRMKLGFSQYKLSYTVGISRQALSRIEKGRIIPNVLTAMRIAAALDTKIENIFQTNDYPNQAKNEFIQKLFPRW